MGNRVLVKQESQEEITKSGIVLPDTADKEKKAIGTIVEVGTGSEISGLGLKVGDKVVFGKYAGEEVEMEDNGKKTEYKILYVGKEKDDSDILAIIE